MSMMQTRSVVSPDICNDQKQLGRFLRSRRESLDPQRLGLPSHGRRRTPGLRREEVAMLADIGVTWYTWLEQGRDVHPSPDVLNALAGALQCSPAETRHLFVLAGLTPTEQPVSPRCEQVTQSARRLLQVLSPQPASLQQSNFNILGYNRAFCRLMGVDLDRVAPEDRNCIWQYLTNPVWRSRLGCQEHIMPLFVAYYRAAMAEHRGDTRWETQLARFFDVSAEFKTVWQQRYEIKSVENHMKRFIHPSLGEFSLHQMNWYSAPRNGTRLLVWLPVDDAGENALSWLNEQGDAPLAAITMEGTGGKVDGAGSAVLPVADIDTPAGR